MLADVALIALIARRDHRRRILVFRDSIGIGALAIFGRAIAFGLAIVGPALNPPWREAPSAGARSLASAAALKDRVDRDHPPPASSSRGCLCVLGSHVCSVVRRRRALRLLD